MTKWTTRGGAPVAHAYEYVVTKSEHPEFPIGTQMIDKSRDLVKTYYLAVSARHDGTFTAATVTAERRRRACSACLAANGRVTPYGHPGRHDQTAPLMPREPETRSEETP